MQILNAWSLILLTQLTSPSFGVPLSTDSITTSSLNPRKEFCYNAPNTVAGTPLAPLAPRAAFPALAPRVLPSSTLWCAYGSSTYVSVTWGYSIAGTAVNSMLEAAYNAIGFHIAQAGDHLVPEGFFNLYDFGLELRMVNANNHQQTWGVMNAGLAAIMQYMARSGRGPGAVAWKVYDGENLVGVGFLQPDGGGK